MSVTSLVLGITALLCGIAAVVSVPVGIAAVVTGFIAAKRPVGKGMAIAGIVMGALGIVIGLVGLLLIFIALPSLQRGQRDVQVKNDVGIASSAINTYSANHQGALPTVEQFNSAEFRQSYLADVETEIVYSPGSDCQGASSTPRSYAVSAMLEVGGTYCLD